MEQQNQQSIKKVNYNGNASASAGRSVWVKLIPNILVILSIFTFILSGSLLVFVYPKISVTGVTFEAFPKTVISLILLLIVVVFCVLQAVLAYSVKRTKGANNFLSRNRAILQTISLCVNIFLIPLMIGFAVVLMVLPLYNLTQELSEIKQELEQNGDDVDSSKKSGFATWQTYRNDEFGFEVRYPKDWFNTTDKERNTIYDEQGNPIELKHYEFSNKKESLYDEYDANVVVFRIDISEDIEFFERIQKLKVNEKSDKLPAIVYTKLGDFTIDGYPAVRYVGDYSGIPAGVLPRGEEVLLRKGNNVFHFMLIGKFGDTVEASKNIFDQILSTFRFVEDVVIYTDKKRYEEGETIQITLKNNGEEAIYLHPFGGLIQKKLVDGTWQMLVISPPPPPYIPDVLGDYRKLKRGEHFEATWDQKIQPQSGQRTFVGSGEFRAVLRYVTDSYINSKATPGGLPITLYPEEKDFQFVYSEDFIIK